jgi:hypothetical protein
MYAFSIEIAFKPYKSLANMRSKGAAVSYYYSSVIDTAVFVTKKLHTEYARALRI